MINAGRNYWWNFLCVYTKVISKMQSAWRTSVKGNVFYRVLRYVKSLLTGFNWLFLWISLFIKPFICPLSISDDDEDNTFITVILDDGTSRTFFLTLAVCPHSLNHAALANLPPHLTCFGNHADVYAKLKWLDMTLAYSLEEVPDVNLYHW